MTVLPGTLRKQKDMSSWRYTNPKLAGGRKLVMIRDSFADACVPILTEAFSESVFLWTNPKDPQFESAAASVIERERPDIVIEEKVERRLLEVPNPAEAFRK